MYTLPISIPFPLLRRSNRRSATIGWIALTVNTISAATFPVLGKELTGIFTPLVLLFVTEIIAMVSLAMYFGLLPMIRQVMKLDRKHLYALCFIGISSGFVGPILWFYGLEYTSAVNSELFSRTQMIFMILLSSVMLSERISAKELFCLSMIFLGAMIVALQGFSAGLPLRSGDMLIVLSSVIYAISGVMYKKYLHRLPPELAVFSRSGCAVLTFFLLSPFMRNTLVEEMERMPANITVVLLIYGLVAGFLSTYTFHEAIDRLPISTVSSVSTLSIVGVIALSAFYLGEHIEGYHAAGASLIIAGIFLSTSQLRLRRHWNQREELHMHQHHRHHL